MTARYKLADARRILAITATALALLIVTSGALALTDADTGVPAVDRFLDAASAPHETRVLDGSHDPLPPGVQAPPRPAAGLQPVRDSASPPLDVSLSDGTRALAVGYQSQGGSICAALADPRAPATELQGFVGCVDAHLLERVLRDQPARIVAMGGANQSGELVVQGVADDTVAGITVVGSAGRVHAALSDAWKPAGWHGAPLRVFFAALGRRAAGGDPRAMTGIRLEARLDDGRSVGITP